MEFRRFLVVGVVAAVVAAGAGLPIAGAAVAQETTATDAADGEPAPMGVQLTAFMQHSASQTDDAVDNGMWRAAFERANEFERAPMATARAHSLGDRLDELRGERETLRAQRDNGTISQAEYAALASELNGRIDALREGINDTERAAARAGLDVDGLESLRESANNMTGVEVAGVARGLAGTGNGQPTDPGLPTNAGQPTDVEPSGTVPTETNGTDALPGDDPPGEGPVGNESGGGDGSGGPGAGDGQPGDGPPGGGPGGNEQGGVGGNSSGSGQSGNSGDAGTGGDGGPGGAGNSG